LTEALVHSDKKRMLTSKPFPLPPFHPQGPRRMAGGGFNRTELSHLPPAAVGECEGTAGIVLYTIHYTLY
jgi:hypothetical protein